MSDYCRVDNLRVIRNWDGIVLAVCWDEDHAIRTAEKLNFWNTQGWPVEEW